MRKEQRDFGQRLRQALRDAKLPESAAALARLVPQHGGAPVTPAAAHRWLRGQSMPRAENMRALSTLLHVRLDWLYGEDAGRPGSGRSSVKEPGGAWQASALDRHAIEAFLALDERRRKLVRELVAALAEAPHR